MVSVPDRSKEGSGLNFYFCLGILINFQPGHSPSANLGQILDQKKRLWILLYFPYCTISFLVKILNIVHIDFTILLFFFKQEVIFGAAIQPDPSQRNSVTSDTKKVILSFLYCTTA